jgi:hypothetical protein
VSHWPVEESKEFFNLLMQLAQEADAATRECS